jgi:hypothetical protein
VWFANENRFAFTAAQTNKFERDCGFFARQSVRSHTQMFIYELSVPASNVRRVGAVERVLTLRPARGFPMAKRPPGGRPCPRITISAPAGTRGGLGHAPTAPPPVQAARASTFSRAQAARWVNFRQRPRLGWCRMPAFTPLPATAVSPTPTAIASRGRGAGSGDREDPGGADVGQPDRAQPRGPRRLRVSHRPAG